MKKLFFIALLSALTLNAKNVDLVNAIIESDYASFNTALAASEPLTLNEQNHLIDLANKMIIVRRDSMVMHSFRPQIGTDLIFAALLTIPAFSGLALASIAAGHLENCKKRDEGAILLSGNLGLGIFITSSCFAIKYFINAWQKPKKLLADAIRIQDALASYQA